jgi:hypothetical protein
MTATAITAYRTKAAAVAAGYSNPYPLERDVWLGSCSPYAGNQYRLQLARRDA